MTVRPTTAVLAAAHALAVDQVTGEVVSAMSEAGIATVLLKGPAIARWLYPEGGRSYCDTDLLVAPSDFDRAAAVLTGLGFVGPPAGRRPSVEHALAFRRPGPAGGPPFSVDLHRTLANVPAEPGTVWAVLAGTTVPMVVGGAGVAVLAEPARAFQVAHHAAHHGAAVAKPLEDLRRAIAVADIDCWRGALAVARRLGAEDLLAAGLRLLPEGRELADELALAGDVRATVRLASTSALSAGTLGRMATAGSLRDWVDVVREMALPPATKVRRRSALARRGRGGLALAYAARPVKLVRRLPLAVRTWQNTGGRRSP